MREVAEPSGLDAQALRTLVPRLAYELIDRHGASGTIHEEIDGTLVSADISGFTRLTEELAGRGREGAEIITVAVNSCFEDLIDAATFHGGDVLKFGGDAVLVLFRGNDHRVRAVAAAQEMQFALRRNSDARRHQLLMTVGAADGPFHAMVLGDERRDLLLCGPCTTATLRLEDGAEKGEVVVSEGVRAALALNQRAGGFVVLSKHPEPADDVAVVDQALIERFVPPALREHWTEYADLGAEHRQAAIGFVMIGGVDEHLANVGGPATTQALSDLIDAVHASLDPTGTALLHSDMAMGGVKLLIGAGVPSSVDDPAGALVHAALGISQIDSPFKIAQGLNIGTVFAGFLGAPDRRTFTVMSDVVNTAARMVGPADAGEVVAVNSIVTRARGRVFGETLDPMQVKGKTELVSAIKVKGVDGSERSGDVQVDFEGRDQELADITEALDRGEGVTIMGPAGSGKTRLRAEAVPKQGVIDGTGGRYMSATPYGAFWAAMRRCLEIPTTAAADDAGSMLDELLRRDYPELAPYAALIAPVIGAELDESDEVRAIGAEFRRDIVHENVTRLLSRQDPPLSAIVVDDTQWLDDASRQLVAHLKLVAHNHGWGVVQSRRNDADHADVADDDSAASAVSIELRPLDDESISSIITQACERQLLRYELDLLVERAHGNPLFALELARAASSPGEEIPDSIEEVVAGRIDRLAPRQRRAVRLASVLGAEFEISTFAALVSGSDSDLDVDVDVVAIDEVFDIADGGAVRFRQSLYRDVAYASLPFARRKRLHKTVGAYLEESSDDQDAISALLSHHFEQARDRVRCWKWSISAAKRAVRQASPADAATLYERALDNAPRNVDPAERASTFAALGHALMAVGRFEDAHGAFGRARRLESEPNTRLQLTCHQGDCRTQQARYSAAMSTYRRVLNDADVGVDEQAVALLGRASVLQRQGRNAESYAEAQRALEAARAASNRLIEGRSLQLVQVSGGAIGSDDSLHAGEQALTIFTEEGMLSEEAEIRNNQGARAHFRGDFDEAADAYTRSLELKQSVGDLVGAAIVQMNLAEVELDRNTTADVDTLLHECLEVFSVSGFRLGSAYTEGLLGRRALMIGDEGAACQLLIGATTSMEELGIEGYAANLDLLLIEALIEAADFDEATKRLAANRKRLKRQVFDDPASAEERLNELASSLDAKR